MQLDHVLWMDREHRELVGSCVLLGRRCACGGLCETQQRSYLYGLDHIDAVATMWIVRGARSSCLSPRTIHVAAAASTLLLFPSQAAANRGDGGVWLSTDA